MGRAYHFHDVGMFHHKFGLENTTNSHPGPREVPEDLMRFRIKFIFEELQELLEGMGFDFHMTLYDAAMGMADVLMVDDQPISDEAKQFDALIDLVYVIYGLAHLKGYPWEEGWNRVQAANMKKVRAERADQSERGGTWDVVKPEGWTPPDIDGLLKEYGW
jgi:predicted HAD superfamily Cof-like phosphohydrolase